MVVAVLWPQSVISSSASGGEVVAVHTLASVVAEPLCLSAFERCAQENVGPSPSKTLQLNEVNLTAGRSLLRIWLFLTMLSLSFSLSFSFFHFVSPSSPALWSIATLYPTRRAIYWPTEHARAFLFYSNFFCISCKRLILALLVLMVVIEGMMPGLPSKWYDMTRNERTLTCNKVVNGYGASTSDAFFELNIRWKKCTAAATCVCFSAHYCEARKSSGDSGVPSFDDLT